MDQKYEYDISNPEKIVVVGDRLTTDILFGNINNMATIWLTNYVDEKDDKIL